MSEKKPQYPDKGWGPPGSPHAFRALLLGGGELGKEVVIELQRFGIETIVADRYENTPAMQVAHRAIVFPMVDRVQLRRAVLEVQPHVIIPEIEAIATDELLALEAEGFRVVPSARATRLTMNREGIRRLAAEELALPVSPYAFADSHEEAAIAAEKIGYPLVVKPVMSSSGKGQMVVRDSGSLAAAVDYAWSNGRAGGSRVILEGFIDFDYEITLLTICHRDGISVLPPLGHRQEKGDYRESWCPQPMPERALEIARSIAVKVVSALGGYGLFGVELFVRENSVWFSEVSPRPHDTGMTTLAGFSHSEFALHVRALLGLPVPEVLVRPCASAVITGHGHGIPQIAGLADALADPDVSVRLFGKPVVEGERRLGVVVAVADSEDDARAKANRAATKMHVMLDKV